MTEKIIDGPIPPQIGPFEILSPLGKGGMGVVYRARDTRLGRDVAIKLIAGKYASEPRWARRFEQEARAISALSHPHIMALYDVGVHEGRHFLVCELLEGQSLKDRLMRGPIPAAQAMRITAEAARGLSAAHAKGIIHRDLKPANIFLTREGTKILDFGLAKAATDDTAGDSSRNTETGMIMGTVSYLSPEQVRCQPLDGRSDLFALGIVLYEMLTGALPFKGDSSAETMAAILHDEPPTPTLPEIGYSTALLRTLAHCLEKDPELRFQSARDLAYDLENLAQSSGISLSSPAKTPAPAKTRRGLLLAGALLTLALGFGLSWLFLSSGKKPLPEFERISHISRPIVAARFLPDGRNYAYSTLSEQGTHQLWVSREAGPQLVAVEDAKILAVSSAGELAIIQHLRKVPGSWMDTGKLVRVFPDGTAKEVLDNVLSADWTPGGKELCAITLARQDGSNEYRIEWPLGTVRYRSQTWIWEMDLAPDNRKLCFCRQNESSERELWVIDEKGPRLLTGGLATLYSPHWDPESERIVYYGSTSCIGNTIQWSDLKGKSQRLMSTPMTPMIWDINSGGEMLVVQGRQRYALKLGLAGAEERDLSWLDQSVVYGLSQDGRRLLLLDRDLEPKARGDATYLRTADGSPAVKLAGRGPYCLSEDGSMSALEPVENSYYAIQLVPTGAGRPQILTTKVRLNWVLAFSPDGQALVLKGNLPGGKMRLFLQPLDGGLARPITPEQVHDGCALSPDGKAVISALPGELPRIYAGPDDPGREIPGLQAGDRVRQWDRDGEHVYVLPKGSLPLEVFRLNLGDGRRKPWLRLKAENGAGCDLENFHITRDGKTYVYNYLITVVSDLYRVTGWR